MTRTEKAWLTCSPMNDYVIGIDVGGTRIKMGAVLDDGTLIETHLCPSGYHQTAEQLEATLLKEISSIQSRIGSAPASIGIAFPGAVDPAKGVVLLPGKLRIEGYPMVSNLADALDLPVIADNDGRLSILGETKYGKARDYDWAVSITLGTGVGSGVLLNGQILRDPHLQFGTQASHIIQQSNSDRLCITRARGTANILCSASALAVLARDGLARGLPSQLNDLYFQDPSRIDYETVLDGAKCGDALCLDVLSTWTKELGWFLVSVVHMYSPQIIIIGGGASTGASYYLEQVRAHVHQHTFRYPPEEEVLIEVSNMPDYGVVKGAAALAWDV